MREDQQDKTHWFDGKGGLLSRVRDALALGMSDTDVVTHFVESQQATAEQVWLCLIAARTLEKS